MIGHPARSASMEGASIVAGWRARGQELGRHRISRWVRRQARVVHGLFPFTFAGLVLLTACLLAAWREGIDHLDLVLLVAGLTVSFITLLMGLVVVLNVIFLYSALKQCQSRHPLSLEAGVFQWTGFEAPFKRWIPWVVVEWDWLRPDGRANSQVAVTLPRQDDTLVETVQPDHRGVLRQVVRRVQVRDILGLACVRWDVPETVDVDILPSRGRLDEMSVLSSLFWGDEVSDPRGDPNGDRVDMRQYAHGDSPRMILWKVYARSRKLMVRIPERAITARPRACAYMVGGEETEAVAGLARVVLERQLLGEGWRFGADGTPGYAVRVPEALHVLARSGTLPEGIEPGSGLGSFLNAAVKDGYSSLFLFLPGRPGGWTGPVHAALAGSPLKVSLFVGSDCLVDAPPAEPRWHKVVFQKRPDPGPGADDLAAVAAQFQRTVSEVWRVDRKAGRLFCDSLLRHQQ